MTRYNPLAALTILSVLAIFPLSTALQPRLLGDMRIKHARSEVPRNWERLGHPGAETTIDLHMALKSQDENALIDALYEVSTPGHPKYVPHYSNHGCTHVYPRAVADMGSIYPRRRSPSSLRLIQKQLSLSTPGLGSMACRPP